MKSLPFDMIALHSQAELHLSSVRLNTRCNIAGVIVCTAAEMSSRRCYKSLIFTLFTWVMMWPMQISPRALYHASVLPRTVMSLVQSSVLGTSRWGNYAQCAQSAVGRLRVETPPNPECCRQTIRAAGIAQACPGTMLTWLLLHKKEWILNMLLGEAQHLDVIGLSLQYEAQGHTVHFEMPCSWLWRCVHAFGLCSIACHNYGLHSFLRCRRPHRTFLVTNIPSSLELVDQTSNGCSRWSFCTVKSTKPFLNLSKGQSIESPT